MVNCNCDGVGVYYYLCDQCDLQAVSGLSKEIAEKAWEVLMKYESKKNESA